MSNADIKSLFHLRRLPPGVPLLLCLIYTPLGLALLTVRFFICAQAVIAFTLLHEDSTLRRLVLRVMCAVLGLWVRADGQPPAAGRPLLLLANALSCADPLAVQLAAPCDAAGSTWPPLRRALRHRPVAAADAVHQCVSVEGRSLLLQPEGATTSGRVGLLTFSSRCLPASGPFEVQPVAVSARRPPVADLRLSTLTSSPLADLLCFLFVPATVYTVSFLEPMKMDEHETIADFLERVRLAISLRLNVTRTKFSAGDKAELVKRETFRARPGRSAPIADAAPAPAAGVSPELQLMASQVKEVLPRVPLTAIAGDLKRTRSVDQTIANLLEGVVHYVPEPEPAAPAAAAIAAPAPAPAAADLSPGATDLCTGAAVFARTSSGRQLSFEERKQRLLDNARRRYIERHQLPVPGYNC